MIVSISQPQYLPYLGFFHKCRQSDLVLLLDDVQFLKHGFQNRNQIKTSSGSQWLTVPVLHDHGQTIKDVGIAPNISWRKKHWAALQSNYGPAPCFKQLAPSLQPLFIERNDMKLVDVDCALLDWAFAQLAITVPVKKTSELGVASEDPNQRLVELCRAVGADTYLSGPGGRAYMDLGVFERAGIAVRFQEYAPREYAQLFPKLGFLPNLAVVDALFNLGRDAASLIA